MNSKRVRNKLECLSRVETCVTFRGHMLSTACLQTLSRSVTSIKARWLEHQNTFGLGSSLSFKQTSTAIRELSRTDGIKISRKTVRKYYKCFGQNSPNGDLPRSGRPPTIQHEHFDFIDEKLEENDELTASGR